MVNKINYDYNTPCPVDMIHNGIIVKVGSKNCKLCKWNRKTAKTYVSCGRYERIGTQDPIVHCEECVFFGGKNVRNYNMCTNNHGRLKMLSKEQRALDLNGYCDCYFYKKQKKTK